MNEVLHIPDLRAVGRKAVPSLIEGKVVPLVLFLGFLELAGKMEALLVALGWSVAVVAYRLHRRQRIPGLVLLSVVGLSVRTALALATGSLVVYFLQPTISTALVGLAFLVSVPLGSPLAERLARDFVPFDPDTAEHPQLKRFFCRLSLLWAFTSLVNTAITAWLLFTQPATTFVLVKSVLGPGLTALTVLTAVVWFRSSLRTNGVRLAFARG